LRRKPKEEGKQESGEKKTTAIDFDDIHLRVITVPLPAGIYGQVAGLSKRRVLATQFPVEGTLGKDWLDEDGEGKGTLLMYDFINAKTETLASKVNDFVLSLDGKTLAYRSGKRLRVLPAGAKSPTRSTRARLRRARAAGLTSAACAAPVRAHPRVAADVPRGVAPATRVFSGARTCRASTGSACTTATTRCWSASPRAASSPT
jgi:hypothetical protein